MAWTCARCRSYNADSNYSCHSCGSTSEFVVGSVNDTKLWDSLYHVAIWDYKYKPDRAALYATDKVAEINRRFKPHVDNKHTHSGLARTNR